jgi:hypothetical protein
MSMNDSMQMREGLSINMTCATCGQSVRPYEAHECKPSDIQEQNNEARQQDTQSITETD